MHSTLAEMLCCPTPLIFASVSPAKVLASRINTHLDGHFKLAMSLFSPCTRGVRVHVRTTCRSQGSSQVNERPFDENYYTKSTIIIKSRISQIRSLWPEEEEEHESPTKARG